MMEGQPEPRKAMFVIIKFGNNQSLLVNPSCAVINLLTSIKRRAGFGGTNKTIDLSDETGLVKDLDVHKYENATKFLQSHETYVLVQKQLLLEEQNSAASESQYTYIPLLERYAEHFPNFRIHVAEVPDKRKSRIKTGHKSPSPAGKLLSQRARAKADGPKKTTRRR